MDPNEDGQETKAMLWRLFKMICYFIAVPLFLWFCIVRPGYVVYKWRFNYNHKGFITVSQVSLRCQAPVHEWAGLPRPPHEPVEQLRGNELTSVRVEGGAEDGVEEIELDGTEGTQTQSQPMVSESVEQKLIYRGRSAPAYQFPWTVNLGYVTWWPFDRDDRQNNEAPQPSCTGGLVRRDMVITAAHCVRQYGLRHYATVGTDCAAEKGGVLLAGVQVRRVRRIIFFREVFWRWGWSSTYSLPTSLMHLQKHGVDQLFEWVKNDMALLQLESEFELSNTTQVLRLAASEELPNLELDKTHVSGWGSLIPRRRDGQTKFAAQLQAAKYPSAPTTEEVTFQKESVTENCRVEWFCFKIKGDQPDTMSGDSGAPVVARIRGSTGEALQDWRLIGTVSGNFNGDAFGPPPDEVEEIRRADDGSVPLGTRGAAYYGFSYSLRVTSQSKASWLANNL